MDKSIYDMGDIDIAWCPGCGNYHILNSLKQALADLDLRPQDVVIASGIGQAAKVPHYLYCNAFNGLHGRSIPPATAIKASNPGLTVISESGDGDQYGEGGNHMIHAMRRNPDITVIVHDNMVYGLTKGQASPTSQEGFKAPIQPDGVFEEPFNPIALGVAMDASFVARANAGDEAQTTEILKKAIIHRGFSLVDVFQPCVTFNKINTYRWFKDNSYYLPDDYDPTDRMAAFAKALETQKRPLGVIYVSPSPKRIFHEATGVYATDPTPLYEREVDWGRLHAAIEALK
jgi:2-oxoglutarate/2-oxoacid ferredoxin oxidoreductase subunit beta